MPTKSGATAAQVARYARGSRQIIKHLGSAHDETTLAVLEAQADELIADMLGAEQLTLELEGLAAGEPSPAGGGARITTVGTSSGPVWRLPQGVYEHIFGAVVDLQVFKDLVIARIIEPTSKADALRVIEDAGAVKVPSLRTLWRHLGRHKPEGWRDGLCKVVLGRLRLRCRGW